MTAAAVSLVVASCVFGGSILAMYAARALPDSHLSTDARDVIKLGMALIATLVALVLGLMIATAKGTYDAQSAVVRQLSANVLLLDRTLAEYGPEAQHPRDLLRQSAELMLQRLWPEDGSAPVSLAPGEARAPMELFLREVTRLSPQNETQAFLKTQALHMTSDLAQARFQMYVQGTSELPLPFLVVVVIWLMILFEFSHPYYSSGLAIAVPVKASSGLVRTARGRCLRRHRQDYKRASRPLAHRGRSNLAERTSGQS